MTYVDFYNKRKYYKNRLNHSYSCCRNNWNINNNINYNNYNNYDSNNDGFYNTDYQCNNFYDYNYNNINHNDYYNDNIEYKKELDIGKCYNYTHNEGFADYERYNRESRNSNDSYTGYHNKNNYNIISPDEEYYLDGFKGMNKIKKEDKKNFLIINKLLYN